RQRAGGAGGRQQQRDGFREIAHRLVTLAAKPLGHAGCFGGPLRKLARFQQPLGAAADQEAYGPRRVLGRRRGQIALEGRHFFIGLSGLVERRVESGEGFHVFTLSIRPEPPSPSSTYTPEFRPLFHPPATVKYGGTTPDQ